MSIDETFVLNATSMLDQTNTSIKEDFASSQINLDLLSYQKNPKVMPSSLRKLFEAYRRSIYQCPGLFREHSGLVVS